MQPAPRLRPGTLLRSPLYLRIVSSVALVLLIPTAFTSLYSLERSSAAHLESGRQHLLQDTSAKATAVEALLLRALNQVLMLSQEPALLRYANALAREPRAATEEVASLFHAFLRRSDGRYDGIAMLDRTGMERVSVVLLDGETHTLPQERLRSRASEPLFSGAQSLTGISGQQAPVYLAQNDSGLHYALPLAALDGSAAGVLVLSAPLPPLLQPLAPDEPDDRVYLVDASGDYLSGHELEQPHGLAASRANLRAQRPGDAGELLGRQRGTLLDTAERPGLLQAFARIRPAGQGTIQWTVISERPLEAVLEGVRESQRLLLATAAGSMVLALLAALVLTRGIVGPIGQLAQAAAAISRGQWETRLPASTRRDEVGALTESFAQMRQQLQAAWHRQQLHVEELKRSQEELRQSRNLLQALIDHSTAVIYVKSIEGRYLLVNWQLAQLAGREREEVEGRADAELWPPAVAAARQAADERVLAMGGPVSEEEVVVLEDGPHTFLSVRFPLRHGSGAPYAVANISTDITDRKRAERALRRARDELEQRVLERTQELREAQSRLMEAARTMGREEVSTTVLHNVGNVLLSVNVSSGLVEEQLRQSRVGLLRQATDMLQGHPQGLVRFLTEDDKGRLLPEYLSRLAQVLVEENARMLADVQELRRNIEHVNNIISVQQSMASPGVQLLEDVDVSSVAEDALRIQMRPGLQIEVVRSYGQVPKIYMDRHKLLQILVNLVSNAKHALLACGRQDKRLEVRIQGAEERVLVQVVDNGVGIRQEDMLRIFQYGFTAKKDGHGFGLHGSALHARSMGGSLRAHSEGLGQGAAFTLELPVRSAPEQGSAVVLGTAAGVGQPPGSDRGRA